jgi:16S rRNA (cytidine1402-2'-O)-methyltransferase
MSGKLYLIPSFLGEDNPGIIPDATKEAIFSLDHFIVENAKTARRYLRAIGYKKNFDTEVVIHELDKHADKINLQELFALILKGRNGGIISEAGCPGIADPGKELVWYAHKQKVEVIPLVGPSSILLALMASGMSGQNFTFHGYLPIQQPNRNKKIKQLENLGSNGAAQIFMETPFRNQKMLEDIIASCGEDTPLCIACDVTLPTQFVKTMKVKEWKKLMPDLHKHYCIFIMGK